MTMQKTYSPRNCVECGESTVEGHAEVKLDINGTVRRVPALYRCLACQGLVDAGTLTSNITPAEALAWLTGGFIPRAYMNVTMGGVPAKWQEAAQEVLTEAMELAEALAMAMFGPASEPDEPLTRAEVQQIIDAVSDSLEMGDDGVTTYLCPNCENRHDAETLFKLLENAV
jgi:hypothetical protein